MRVRSEPGSKPSVLVMGPAHLRASASPGSNHKLSRQPNVSQSVEICSTRAYVSNRLITKERNVSNMPDPTPGYAECAAMTEWEMIEPGKPRHVLLTRRS